MWRQGSNSGCQYRNTLPVAMKKVWFKETQKYSQGWKLFLILFSHLSVMILFIYALIQQTVYDTPFGDKPAPNWVLVLLLIVTASTMLGMLIMKLDVWIDQQGIHYRYFPLIWKERIIKREEIASYQIRKYNPIAEYGGWGIRTGFLMKYGKAYNVTGNIGLQLILTNGKKVLFGTQ